MAKKQKDEDVDAMLDRLLEGKSPEEVVGSGHRPPLPQEGNDSRERLFGENVLSPAVRGMAETSQVAVSREKRHLA